MGRGGSRTGQHVLFHSAAVDQRMKTNRHILVIDDDYLDVMTLKRAFKEAEVTNPLVVASNGEEALVYLRNLENPKPSLIVLDLNTPRMNGLEFLQIIKADPQWRRIPVIVLTTSNHEHDRQQSYEFSVAGYIVKPMDYDAFVQIVKTIAAYWMLSELPD